MLKKTLLALSLTALVSACATQTTSNSPASSTQVQTSNAATQLNDLLENCFQQGLALYPVYGTYLGDPSANSRFNAPINDESLNAAIALEESCLNKVSAIDSGALAGQEALSQQIFIRDMQLNLAGNKFPEHYMPINQMNGLHNVFAGFGSGQSAQPFNSKEDYENFIQRANEFTLWLDSVITQMRNGIKHGVTLPRSIATKLVPQFEAHIVSDPETSLFWGPMKNLPESMSAEEKSALDKQYRHMILDKLVPAYQKMTTFLKDEYLPAARATVGYSDLPNGKAWYEHQIKKHTTLNLTADEIHEIGLKEVERILQEMINVKQTVGFKGDLPAFFHYLQTDDQFYFSSEQEVIDAYTKVKDKINARLPQLFEVFPKADYEVKAVEPFRAASAAGASYQPPAPDGSRPGIFYINTHNLKAQPNFILETLSIHEASPGHHFQLSIQQEVKALPKFRRFGGYTVYAEGWALYAESLGKDMGLFTDPYQWYGRLVDEQLRAMRLVVDTGLHAKGWTREQAIDFMRNNSSMADSDIEAEVERYISWPGQALSYKLGQFEIRNMRNYAEAELGEKFDVRKFHTQVLIDGALPMPVLKDKIYAWVETQR